jgi:transposase InsO family protein
MNHPTDRQLEIAAFRHRLLASALEAEEGGVSARLKEAAGRPHRNPDEVLVQVALSTLWKWLAAYRRGGLIALCPTPRKDRGVLRAFPPTLLEAAMRLRQENPQRSSTTIIDIMEREELVPVGAVARSTLDRHLDRMDLSRRRLGTLAKKTFRRICAEAPFELVVGDFHHGPLVRIGEDGATRRAIFLGFVDHYSRFVAEGRYYLTEDTAALRFGFRRMLLVHGMPLKLFMDNGPAFHSHRFHAACGLLGINLIHSRPYEPESRGLIERFNRTIKEQFESEVHGREVPPTLEELNAWLAAWLSERYHRTPHSETKETPEQRFKPMPAGRPAPPLEILEEYLRECETRTVHKKWSTVEVEGTRFLVHPSLRGRKIQVLYDPLDLAYVLVCFQGRAVERAHPQPANEAALQSEAQPVLQGQRTDYLGRLRADYEGRMRQELAAIQVRPTPREQDVPGLTALLEVCRGTTLSEPEASDISTFWQRLRPLDADLTGRLLANARRRLGIGLHISVYLTALEDQLVRHRSAPTVAPKVKAQPRSRKPSRGAKP